jgi:2-oxoglutarate ferredoxin oxidoreductase subunit gamma
MDTNLFIAGVGGQGIIAAGQVTAAALMVSNQNVACVPSYHAEMRGGIVYTTVIVSEGELVPFVEKPAAGIFLSQIALDLFENSLEKNALLILNSSLVKEKVKRKDLKLINIPATEIADKIGNTKTANIVCLGAYISASNLFDLSAFKKGIQEAWGKKSKEILKNNIEAFKKGLHASVNI